MSTPFVFSGIPGLLFWTSFIAWNLIEMFYTARDVGKIKNSQDDGTKKYLMRYIFIGIFIGFTVAWVAPWLNIEADKWALLIIGISFLWLGIILRSWAVATLGKYFRREVMVQKNHKVIDYGPYFLIRHPSYTGSILTFLGIGIALGNWLSVLACLVIPFIGYKKRISQEEKILAKDLGHSYKEYMETTKRLIPYLY